MIIKRIRFFLQIVWRPVAADESKVYRLGIAQAWEIAKLGNREGGVK